MNIKEQREAILREALDQYVTNLGEHVETGEDITAAEREKLAIAEGLLDEMNTDFLFRLGL